MKKKEFITKILLHLKTMKNGLRFHKHNEQDINKQYFNKY